MPMKRCDSGHYFDTTRHSSCPSCGVVDLRLPRSKSAEAAAPHLAPGPGGKTVPLLPQKGGLDPVVGWLVCVAGPECGRDFRLHGEKNFIGRSPEMDVSIRGDEMISRESHAIVTFNPRNNGFKLHPGESRGLVYLNGKEVDSPVPLKDRDRIEIGQTKLVFVPFCGSKFKWQ